MGQKRARRRLPATFKAGKFTALLSPTFLEQEETPGTRLPTEDELRRSIAGVPEDLSWEWARPRLAPLFERMDGGGMDGDPSLHAVTSLGVAVGFGIDIGSGFARVTASLAQRWEANLEQIEHAAFAHLQRVVGEVQPSVLQQVVHRGHMVRALTEPGGWASSAILAGVDEIRRIFGPHDQVFTAPSRNVLLAFDATTPSHAVADVSLLMEEADPHPLRLDPFYLEDGQLVWGGVLDPEYELDEPI